MTTAVDSRCATSETKGNWCVSVLSRVLDLRETAKSGRSGRALCNAAQRNRTEEYSEESADMEQAITQMRQDLQELQIAMQHQQAGLIQQEPRQRNKIVQTWQELQARVAARVEDGDISDNEAVGQPIKCTGKKDSDVAEWDQKVRIFTGARCGHILYVAMSWASTQRKPIVRSCSDSWRRQIHCRQ